MNSLYSKKVMQHFKNPKNMGEMKDADGIGEVGNLACGDVMRVYIKVKNNKIADIKFQTMGCLPPDEKISSEASWTSILDIRKGDLILNGEGRKTKVKRIYRHKFDGSLIRITPFVSKYNSFLITPTHPILCIKRKFLNCSRKSSNKCKWLRIKEKELASTKPYYVEAEYLEVGDYLVFPKLKEIRDTKELTKDMMKLLGYYLSEGYVTSNNTYLNFSFHKNEKDYIDEVKGLLKILGINSLSQRTRENVTELRIYSPKLATLMIKFGGKYAREKQLSKEIILLPFEKQTEMIKTYICGDGNLYKRRQRDTETYRLGTASEQLAIQFQEILAKGGIFASIKKRKQPVSYIAGRKITSGTLFEISFKLKKTHKFARETKDYFLVPIKELKEYDYSGKVYNLEVSGNNHSYLVKGFAVHNCIAAIATSSMVTELAKGKNIEEARKITNKDVADSLGNLPPIKMHCSNLAANALRKAIENYENKMKGGNF